MRITKKSKQELEKYNSHPKTWGAEFWIENCPEYCGKVMEFHAGGSTSMHFHKNKLETMFLIEGEMEIILIDTESSEEYQIRLSPGESIQIPRLQPHSIRAVKDSFLIEFSTHHEDSDSYRLWRRDK